MMSGVFARLVKLGRSHTERPLHCPCAGSSPSEVALYQTQTLCCAIRGRPAPPRPERGRTVKGQRRSDGSCRRTGDCVAIRTLVSSSIWALRGMESDLAWDVAPAGIESVQPPLDAASRGATGALDLEFVIRVVLGLLAPTGEATCSHAIETAALCIAFAANRCPTP